MIEVITGPNLALSKKQDYDIVELQNSILSRHILSDLLKNNPHLILGDEMRMPVNLVNDEGTIITNDLTLTDPQDFKVIFAKTYELKLDSWGEFDMPLISSLEGKYLHPYQIVRQFTYNSNSYDMNFQLKENAEKTEKMSIRFAIS